MSDFRVHVSAALVTVLCLTSASAQAPPPPVAVSRAHVATTTDTSKSGTVADVETWTDKEWKAARREWAKDGTKWADCRSQSRKQKLAGRKSWSFLYTCMAS